MSTLLYDIKYAARVMARERVFAATVVLTLALCIGANAAIFTIVNDVVLRPLPLASPERLVHVTNSYPGAGVTEAYNSVPDYYDRRSSVAAFEDVALYRDRSRAVGLGKGAERVEVIEATPSLLRLLGAQPVRGRVFGEQDGERGQQHTVVLTDAFWHQQFGGRDDAIGQTLRLDGTPHTIVGVLPAHFGFVSTETRLWLPLAFSPEQQSDESRHDNSFEMIARLRPGASLAQAQQQIDAINRVQTDRSPLRQQLIDVGFTTRTQPFHDHLVGSVKRTLYLLWAGVFIVLLIGVVNVTNLTLVRAAARGREFATRQALGAGTWRIMRQLFTESIVLTAIAATLGGWIAYAMLQVILAGARDRIPRAYEVGLDATAILFTAGIALLAGALVAVLPLVSVRRRRLAEAMREEGRAGTAGPRTRFVRRALVTAQVACAFVLLIGGGLLLASFREVLRVSPGFEAAGALTGRVNVPAGSYPKDDQVITTLHRLLDRVNAIPGVSAAGAGDSAPLTGSYSSSVILPEGYRTKPGESLVAPAQSIVSAGYFNALRIPVKRGRAIDERDTAASQPVVVVDERLAQIFWPGQDPIGRRMFKPDSVEEFSQGPGPNTRWLTVVGVVGSVRQRGLASEEEGIGAYYFPLTQRPSRSITLVARTTADPASLASAIRRELAAIDPEVPLYDVLTMEERVREAVAGRRTAMLLAVGFGVVALLLATVGMYGVLAYQVSQRTREIGIRIALGSNAGAVFTMILREGAVLIALGFALGLAGARAMRDAVAGELYGVDPMEPAVLAGVALVLGVVALFACALPARRASRIDPVVALAE